MSSSTGLSRASANGGPERTAARISPRTHQAAVRSAIWMLLAGIGIAVLGYLPLQLSIWFGPAVGNPIGLDLLTIVAVPAGMILAAFGVLRLVIAMLLLRSQS